jgi:DNA-binding transcriptional ArsR family regulator
VKPCGTPAAYQRHIRHGETPCDECREAASAYRNRFPRRRPESAWTMRDEIVDFLGLEGSATVAEIAARFGRHIDSVERVLRILRDEELVASRTFELATASHRLGYDRRTEWRLL